MSITMLGVHISVDDLMIRSHVDGRSSPGASLAVSTACPTSLASTGFFYLCSHPRIDSSVKLHLNPTKIFWNKHTYIKSRQPLWRSWCPKQQSVPPPSQSPNVAQGAGSQAALHDWDNQDAEHGECRPQGGEWWPGHDASDELRLDLVVL